MANIRRPITAESRRITRRLYGQEEFQAILGNEDGVIDVPSIKGKRYVRQFLGVDSDGNTTYDKAKVAWSGYAGSSGYGVWNGSPVIVSYTSRGELGIKGTDEIGYTQGGGSMTVFNPSDPRIYGYSSTQAYIPLLAKPVGTDTTASMNVHVWPFLWIDIHGTPHSFEGAAIDLTAHVPATANNINLCLIVLNTDDTLSAYSSTQKLNLEVLGIADVKECLVDQANAESIPCGLFKMYNGQTTILGSDIYADIRLRINHPTPATLPSLPNPVIMNVTIEAGRECFWHAGLFITTGSLFILGTGGSL